jgi:hypothetical protein
VLADPRLQRFFEGVDMKVLAMKQVGHIQCLH